MLPTRSPSPEPKRSRTERAVSQPPQRVQALQSAESFVAYTVLSDAMPAVIRIDDAITSGILGFYGPKRPVDDRPRLLQLSWAATSSGTVVKQRNIASPGLAAAGPGLPLADVLVEFMDCLITMPEDFRLVTYHIEASAGVILQEMHRCGLRYLC